MNYLISIFMLTLFGLTGPQTPESQEQHCSKLTASVQDKISKARGCSSDEECTIAGLGCPFGCGTPLNKVFVPQIKEAVREHQEQCTPCEYRCARQKRRLKCHEGECSLLPKTPSFSTPKKQQPSGPAATAL